MQIDAQIPTQAELGKLPRWANVAFAARCARRVQPLFESFWSHELEEYQGLVDTAISFSAKAASEGIIGLCFAQAAAEAMTDAARAAEAAVKLGNTSANPAARAALSAAEA